MNRLAAFTPSAILLTLAQGEDFGALVYGRPDKVCPMTIALTPQEDGTFLLGCGWCKTVESRINSRQDQ